MTAIDPERLVFIDESGSHIGMTREYAWSPLGTRVHGRVPRNRGVVLTMLGALARNGVRAMMTNGGGTNRQVFLRFLSEHVAPSLRPGDVVVMDDLGAHHATGVREIIAAAGARILYMPAYSPDLNPIELCWSKLKGTLKSIGARTVATLIDAVGAASERITPRDAEGWFRHCGYGAQESPRSSATRSECGPTSRNGTGRAEGRKI